MKGDFTRSTFDPTKHYTSVRMQQGRVPMDADWNEAQDISKALDETTRIDVIGPCGFPKDAAGFGIIEDRPPTALIFGSGKGYVDGMLCINEAPVSLSEQPYLPGYPLPATDGFYLAYLDVWERHITALEDATIKEVALGGLDTATRLQTIWQIKLAPLPDTDTDTDDRALPDCADFGANWQPADRAGTSQLKARAEINPTDERPCIVPAQAGYRRLENQLYRVEIHQGGPGGTATFKWSRDNGSIVAGWSGPDALDTKLSVTTVGRDNELRFAPNQWVELTDDRRELAGDPGELVRVVQAEGQILEIDQPINRTTFFDNPKVRRWDHAGGTGALVVEEGRWLTLESGVQIWFQPPAEGTANAYHTGDYWMIPARTIGASVLWPQNESGTDEGDGSGDPAALVSPQGILHHYCVLGILQRTDRAWQQLQDCRPLFPPLTDLPLQTQACGEIAVSPEDDLQAAINQIPAGGNAKLCLHPGVWQLTATVTIANKGHIVISGAGAGTHIVGERLNQRLDRCLLFESCNSVTVQDLQVSGGNAGNQGSGLQGALTFLNCESVTLERVRAVCNGFLSRRVSAVQVWANSAQRPPTNVCIRKCHITVGHQQIGIVIVNGGRVIVAENTLETPRAPFKLSGVLANAQDSALIAAVGRRYINRIVVGRENLPEDAFEALVGGPVGVLPEPTDALGQHRIIANLTEWSQPFAFSTDERIGAEQWREILEANSIQARAGSLEFGIVATRLRQLRSRLVRRLFRNTTVDVSIPSIAVFAQVNESIERSNQFTTGSQGIVIGGDRTPRFGRGERFANGLFMIDGDRAPSATITQNQITGFAEGIHIGTSANNSKYHRSYQVEIEGNIIHLRASSLASERHGIFVGHAHTVNIQSNTIQVVAPNPTNWNYQRGRNVVQRAIPPTDGIHLTGVYGPLLSIQHNHCIGVTRGITVSARNAGLHEVRYEVVPAWSVLNNAYAGIGQAQALSSTPADRF